MQKTNKTCSFLFTVTLILFSETISSQNNRIKVFEADFSSTNKDNIYEINTQVGIATIFELPKGKSINQFIIGDPGSWKSDCDGVYGIISPKRSGIKTSLTIITTSGDIYTFILKESPGDIVGKVRISIISTSPFFKQEVERGVQSEVEKEKEISGPETFEMIKTRCLKSKKYKVKNNQFNVEYVVDDGIFTYLLVQKSQVRPAIFLQGDGQGKSLEPLRYFDKGDFYVIHRVLSGKEEFLLKIGNDESRIKIK